MYPVQRTVLGTGVCTAVFPDFYQNPFNIGVAVQISTGNATYQVEHTFNYSTIYDPKWAGGIATSVPPTDVPWYVNSGVVATSVATCNANYAFPVAAIRLNVLQASSATTSVTLYLIQASNAP